MNNEAICDFLDISRAVMMLMMVAYCTYVHYNLSERTLQIFEKVSAVFQLLLIFGSFLRYVVF